MRVVDRGGEAELPILSVAHLTAIFVRVVTTALREHKDDDSSAFGCLQSDRG
jgi:hypothetical protein